MIGSKPRQCGCGAALDYAPITVSKCWACREIWAEDEEAPPTERTPEFLGTTLEKAMAAAIPVQLGVWPMPRCITCKVDMGTVNEWHVDDEGLFCTPCADAKRKAAP